MTLLATALHNWQPFYSVLGASAATLIGLTFVMVSLGVRVITEESAWRVHVFVTPLILHLTGVLVLSLLLIAPCPNPRLLPIEIAALGIAALLYLSSLIPGLMRLHAENSVVLTWKIYGVYMPGLCYIGVVTGGMEMTSNIDRGFWILAAALLLLVAITIRNIWSSTITMAAKSMQLHTTPSPHPVRRGAAAATARRTRPRAPEAASRR